MKTFEEKNYMREMKVKWKKELEVKDSLKLKLDEKSKSHKHEVEKYKNELGFLRTEKKNLTQKIALMEEEIVLLRRETMNDSNISEQKLKEIQADVTLLQTQFNKSIRKKNKQIKSLEEENRIIRTKILELKKNYDVLNRK